MDAPHMETMVKLAEYMSAEAIVSYYKERGFPIKLVEHGLYPIGLEICDTTFYISSLQPKEERS